jgi:hypothetical protein
VTFLYVIVAVVVVIALVVFGLVYWSESRRPQTRSRPGSPEPTDPASAEVDR